MKLLVSDDELIAQFKKGNLVYFWFIHERYYRSICYYASQFIDNIEDREEIVTDSFFKLIPKYADFDSVRAINKFLYTTTRNACFNYLRNKKRYKIAEQDYAHTLTDIDENNIEQAMIQGEFLRIVYEAANKLPMGSKEIFELCFIEGLHVKDIARQLGVSVKRVRGQKHRAIKALRITLVKKGLLAIVFAWLVS
jgi:RNA polymerase sigma-70 factor (family 1)